MEAIVGGLVDGDGKESSAGSNGSVTGLIGATGATGKPKRRKSKGSKPDGEPTRAQDLSGHLMHIAPDFTGHHHQTPSLSGLQPSPEHITHHHTVPPPQPPQHGALQQHAAHAGFVGHQPSPVSRLDTSQSPEVVPTSHASTEGYSPLHRDLMNESTYSTPSPVLGSQHTIVDPDETTPKIDPSCHHMHQQNGGSEMDDLEDDMGHLTLDRVGQERYVGKSSPMWYSERHYGGICDTLVPIRPAAAKFVENLDLPSPEVMSHLINLHLKHVHPFAPVFIWSKFLRRLQAGDYDPSFLLLLNALFALASRFSDDVSLRTDPTKPETAGLQFVQKAKAILDIVYDTSDSTIIAGLVLLSYQRVGTGGGWAAWMFVGLAIRMAQHIGLNRDPSKLNRNMHPLIREERNRIWWSLGIHEHDCDAPYPEGIEDETVQLECTLPGATTILTGPTPGSEKNFVHMASLIRILGRVMTNLYSPNAKASSLSSSSMTNSAPLEQLDKELTDWLLTLPPHLQFRSVQQEPGNFVCTLHMTFYATLILLHRPYAHHSKHRTGNDPSISLSICTSAANNAIEIASSLNRAQPSPVPGSRTRIKYMFNYISFILFTAGVVHINNCTSLDPELAAMAKMRTMETLTVLEGVKDVWITGYWCSNNLKRLIRLRNIELPIPIEMPPKHHTLQGGDDDKARDAGTFVGYLPNKEQSFAFDVNHIMGYYQAVQKNLQRREPMGRNSRHFSPSPYYNSAHHSQSSSHLSNQAHPGLAQGHVPLPRRPRQTKNSSPTPSQSHGSSGSGSGSGSIAEGFTPSPTNPPILYSNMPESDAATTTQQNMDPTLFVAAGVVSDPFGVPGSATLPTGLPPAPLQGQVVPERPAGEAPLNVFPNPFSSSLWSIPTSMDNDEWMLYMQNAQSGQGMDGMQTPKDGTGSPVTGESPFKQSPSSAAPSPLPGSPMVSGSVGGMTAAGGAAHTSRNTHPLAQSMTSQDLDNTFHNHMSLAAAAAVAACSTVDAAQYDPHLMQTTQPSPPQPSMHQSQQQQQQQHPSLSQATVSAAVSPGVVGFVHNPLTNPVIPQTPLRTQHTTSVPSEYDFFLGNVASLGVQQPQSVQQAQ
ncbi:hypothetical protein BGZ73_002801 [Actinomortierella ambigua]|nr:hypothetical protein BGZ73_002801 [Actinomortierella ambigua]